MRLAVFGATGRVGQRVVEYALAAGHEVSALVRDPARLPLADARLHVHTGDVRHGGAARSALAGADAVVSALGAPSAAEPGTALSDGLRAIVDAMAAAGAARILAVGNAGVLDDEDGRPRLLRPDFPAEYLPVTREHARAWESLRASDRAWTFACPPDLRTGMRTGRVRARRDRLPDGAREVSVEDVAAWLVEQSACDEWTGTRVGIAW